VLTQKSFVVLKAVNPKVIQFLESRLIKRGQFSSKHYYYVDPIAEALYVYHQKNTTNTFRKFTENEATLIFRSFIMIAERPFVEENPIAGLREHRRISIESFVRLFGN